MRYINKRAGVRRDERRFFSLPCIVYKEIQTKTSQTKEKKKLKTNVNQKTMNTYERHSLF